MFSIGRIARPCRRGIVSGLLLAVWALGSLHAREVQPGPKPTPAPAVEAWAMLFQMMDRLRAAVAQRDLILVHIEDPVASTAVSTLLGQLVNSWTPNAAAKKIAWTVFVRDISALHTAADAAQEEACVELLKRVENEFQKLQEDSDPAVLKTAHQYAERYTCPMHSDVVGTKDDTCGKCGMTLDQLVVLLPRMRSREDSQCSMRCARRSPRMRRSSRGNRRMRCSICAVERTSRSRSPN